MKRRHQTLVRRWPRRRWIDVVGVVDVVGNYVGENFTNYATSLNYVVDLVRSRR